MTDYSLYPCPSGFYCIRGEEPHLCPAGRMRNETGAGDPTDCPLCRAGYYCPNDTINTHGIPCPERYFCEEGAALPTDCEPGYYCPAVTGVAPICPAGYFCEGLTLNPELCEKPYYCPEGSNMTFICPLGYQAMDHAGIRYDVTESCRICPAGTYGNYTDRSICESCPPGYYCPEGTGHGNTYPCTKGSYCPYGSYQPTSCPKGYYGTTDLATSISDCTACPAKTFSNNDFATECETCGGTSTSSVGSTACTCKGKYRDFQLSIRACVCKSGYIYYDETNTVRVDGDSSEDCQQISDERCNAHQQRDAATRKCVDPDTVDCSNYGSCTGSGYYNRDFGRYAAISCQHIQFLSCPQKILVFLHQDIVTEILLFIQKVKKI